MMVHKEETPNRSEAHLRTITHPLLRLLAALSRNRFRRGISLWSLVRLHLLILRAQWIRIGIDRRWHFYDFKISHALAKGLFGAGFGGLHPGALYAPGRGREGHVGWEGGAA